MSVSFSQTLRSLEADPPRNKLWGIIGMTLLLLAWLGWGLLSRVTLYEVTAQAQLEGSATVVAEFAPALQGRLQVGQTAQLRLDSYPWLQYGTVPAIVTDVPRQTRGEVLPVRLALQPRPDQVSILQHGLTGTLEVEIEQVSPLLLLLRAAGHPLAQ